MYKFMLRLGKSVAEVQWKQPTLYKGNNLPYFCLDSHRYSSNSGIQPVTELPLHPGEFTAETAAEYLKNLDEKEKAELERLKVQFSIIYGKRLNDYKDAPECLINHMKDEWWASIIANSKSLKTRVKRFPYYVKIILGNHKKSLKKSEEVIPECPSSETKKTYTIFLRLYKRTITHFYRARLCHSMMFGRPLVIDMNYDEYMNKKTRESLVSQIINGCGYNQLLQEPYNTVFTSFDRSSYIYQKLNFVNHNAEPPIFFPETTELSYLDLYPKDKLVYLSPNARKELLVDHPDNIYIIGGYVDSFGQSLPISFNRAMEDGIRCAKLPVDRFLRSKKKELNVDAMMKVMLEFMRTNDWNKALEYVPTRVAERQEENADIDNTRFKKKRSLFDAYSS